MVQRLPVIDLTNICYRIKINFNLKIELGVFANISSIGDEDYQAKNLIIPTITTARSINHIPKIQ